MSFAFDVDRVADEITEGLFVSQGQQRATRLVIETARKLAGAGWCRAAIKSQIAEKLYEIDAGLELQSRLLASIRKEDCVCDEMTCNHCIAVFIESGELEKADRCLSRLESLAEPAGRDQALRAAVGSMKLVPDGMTAAEYLEHNRQAMTAAEGRRHD